MRVFETQLRGVGERFSVEFDDGHLVVVIHNDGGRDVYWRPGADVDPDADADRLFRLTERQARTLAEVFDGTYFEPVPDDVEDVLAVRRGERTVPNPEASFEVEAGDVPVVVGDAEAHDALERLLTGRST